MAKKHQKTNAMRILDSNKIDYNMYTYEVDDNHIDGISVAHKLNQDENMVFVIPVAESLDMKKAAKAAGEKNVEMIHVKDINKVTGYIRGGCSPVGMKKLYPTFVHESAMNLEKIIVSGGKIGFQIELKPKDLQKTIGFKYADIIK